MSRGVPELGTLYFAVSQPPKRPVNPALAKAICSQFEACQSSSRRLGGFVCGSRFCHADRVASCVEYGRLRRGVVHGVRGGRQI